MLVQFKCMEYESYCKICTIKILLLYITIIEIKDLDNVEFVKEEIFAEASLSWALDRIDQVSPVLDGIFETGGDGEGVDIYILDTGKEECFECVPLNLILYIGIDYDHYEFDGNRAICWI